MELWGATKVAEETGMSVSYSQKLIKRLNDELAQKGIILEDTREGVKWKRA